VVSVGRQAGAAFLIESDAHSPDDLLTEGFQRLVGLCAGLSADEVDVTVRESPRRLLAKIEARRIGRLR
jgi:hypothetical protein